MTTRCKLTLRSGVSAVTASATVSSRSLGKDRAPIVKSVERPLGVREVEGERRRSRPASVRHPPAAGAGRPSSPHDGLGWLRARPGRGSRRTPRATTCTTGRLAGVRRRGRARCCPGPAPSGLCSEPRSRAAAVRAAARRAYSSQPDRTQAQRQRASTAVPDRELDPSRRHPQRKGQLRRELLGPVLFNDPLGNPATHAVSSSSVATSCQSSPRALAA